MVASLRTCVARVRGARVVVLGVQSSEGSAGVAAPGVADKELNRTEGGEQLFVRGVTNPHLHPWGSAEPES